MLPASNLFLPPFHSVLVSPFYFHLFDTQYGRFFRETSQFVKDIGKLYTVCCNLCFFESRLFRNFFLSFFTIKYSYYCCSNVNITVLFTWKQTAYLCLSPFCLYYSCFSGCVCIWWEFWRGGKWCMYSLWLWDEILKTSTSAASLKVEWEPNEKKKVFL